MSEKLSGRLALLCQGLKWIAERNSQVALAPVAAVKGIRVLGPRRLILSVSTLLLVAVVTGLAIWILKPLPSPQLVTRRVINLPSGQELAGMDNGPVVALSPDGNHLAFVAIQGRVQRLYLWGVDSGEAKPIPGTDGGLNPFFSPDGQWVGFFAAGKLKKVSVSGGSALSLGEAADARGASWGDQGMIAFAPSGVTALQQESDAGSATQSLTRLEKGEVAHRWPAFLPGGREVLFAAGTSATNWTTAQVAVESLRTGERRNLIQGGTQPRYAPSGHLVYAQGGRLMAVAFDPQRLTTIGMTFTVLDGVMQSITGAAQYCLSAAGSLVYVPGGVRAPDQSNMVWVNRNGAEQPLAAPAHAYLAPRISPDGHQVAVGITEQEIQTWLYNLSLERLTRLTSEGNINLYPSWTPNGKRVSFYSNKEGPQNLFWELADGSGGLERLNTSEYAQAPNSWSPDGQLLAFVEVNPTTGRDIWVLRLADRKALPYLRTPFNESAPRFSPDGRWLAYVSDESGRYEIYVQPYPGPGGKWQISTDGGTEAVWNPNARELFFRNGDKMMAVDIATHPGFVAGKPRMLFEGQYVLAPGTSPDYDVSPDGQRFLMLKPADQAQGAPTQINVVLNWFEELRRRVTAGTK